MIATLKRMNWAWFLFIVMIPTIGAALVANNIENFKNDIEVFIKLLIPLGLIAAFLVKD